MSENAPKLIYMHAYEISKNSWVINGTCQNGEGKRNDKNRGAEEEDLGKGRQEQRKWKERKQKGGNREYDPL
jgi:hypothetical protein